MEIRDNLLLMSKQTEFTNKIIRYFFDRLKLFLLVDYNIPDPLVCFTNSYEKMDEYYDGNVGEVKDCAAFYDETSKTVVFNANAYNIKSTKYNYQHIDFYEKEKVGKYKYVIPLSVIYHELIHHLQYNYANYTFTDFIEGSAELYSYILTGQNCIDYEDECLAIWYMARKVLKLDVLGFYAFVSKIIVNPNFQTNYLFFNKSFLRTLEADYANNLKSYMNSVKKDYAPLANKKHMLRDLDKLHKLLFYRY